MKITLGWVASYVVGIPLFLTSLILTYFSLWGIIPLACSLLILPVVRNVLANHADIEFSRGGAVSIGIVGGLSLILIVSALTVGAILDSDSVDINGSEDTEENVSAVALTGQDDFPSDPDYAINVQWNATAQKTVDPDPDSATYYSSDAGEKFVVLRLRITNTGENDFEPDADLFRIEIDGVEYHRQSLFGSGQTLGGVTQTPGSTREGWVAYKIPENATEGTIITHQDAYRGETVAVSFEHDPEMTVGIPEYE